jgi:Holliday junction resolvasome RuvABC DNA-binding subunit
LVSALLNLGYKPAAARRTAEEVARRNPGAGIEEQLCLALKVMVGNAPSDTLARC